MEHYRRVWILKGLDRGMLWKIYQQHISHTPGKTLTEEHVNCFVTCYSSGKCSNAVLPAVLSVDESKDCQLSLLQTMVRKVFEAGRGICLSMFFNFKKFGAHFHRRLLCMVVKSA